MFIWIVQEVSMANNQLSNVGLFVPSNYTWDVSVLYQTDINSPEFKELLVRLYQNINSMCIALNLKDSAYYIPTEFLNGQTFFPNPSDPQQQPRQAFRTVVNTGTLPNNGTTSTAHNIDFAATYSFTRIYGAATDQIGLTAIPIPYVTSSGTGGIELDVTATDVVLTTTGNYSAYTVSYVVLEYLKN